jgi:peptidoglycan/xylan/chitin deacetylase (PgdA/CDA1 family)
LDPESRFKNMNGLRGLAQRLVRLGQRGCLWLLAMGLTQAAALAATQASCQKPVYLTLDTGHMGVAEEIAQVLQRQQIRVSFFAADEPTQTGDGSLGQHWASWWKARAAEGHVLASHTLNHVYWRRDLPDGRFEVRASAGPEAGVTRVMDAAQYCTEIRNANQRLQHITGAMPLPLYRAPGGKTSKALLAAAKQCGYVHVGWSAAGFLGDELPSDRYPNSLLLARALRDIRSGDVLLAHLGIWSRKQAWAPEVLEPLITGLKQKGFCFDTIDHHPAYAPWVQAHFAH